MTTINDAYINGLLADASYVDNFIPGMTGIRLADLIAGRMTPALATYIGNNFTVKTQESDPASSFDATVWQGNADTPYAGKIYVSMRGTQELLDFAADADLASTGLAHQQLAAMVNWWLKATTPITSDAIQIALEETIDPASGQVVQQDFVAAPSVRGTGELSDVSAITSVNGHSLGGYLASAFGRLFGGQWPIGAINTFNSAGFLNSMAPNIEDGFGQIAQVIGQSLGVGRFATGNEQNNYYASNGVNVTTNDWGIGVGFMQYGTRIGLWQEDSIDGVDNHYMYKLTDLLALGNALMQLDPTLDLTKLSTLVSAGSNRMVASYESVLDGFRKLLVGADVKPTQIGDANAPNKGPQPDSRIDYQKNIADLQSRAAFKALAGKAVIESLTGKFAPDLVTLAQGTDAKAYRYALKELNPFAVLGFDYSQFNKNGELNLATDPTPGDLTANWLAARAQMLAWTLKLNTADVATSNNKPYAQQGTPTIYFEDQASDTKIYLGQTAGGNSDRQHFVFGAAGKILEGGAKDDGLFAGDGNETLIGGYGNDYLEAGGHGGVDLLKGGVGNDTYQLGAIVASSSNVTDTIDDTDGKGSVWIGETQLRALGDAQGTGTRNADGSITWTVDKVQYLFSGANPNAIGTMTMTGGVLAKNNDSIVIKNFDLNQAQTSAGYLGIQLGQAQLRVEAGTQKKSIMDVLSDKGAEVVNWAKGAVQTLTVYASEVVDHAQKILVNVADAFKSFLGLNTGASLETLANGPIELTIPAGQDSVTVALVKTAEITGNQTIGLTAILENPDGTTPANAASDTLTFNYQGPANVTTTPDRTILGDLAPVDFSGQYHLDDLGNLLVDPNTPAPGLNDNLYDSSGNDLINAGDGNNFVAAFHGGNDTIMAGAGNDSIYGGAGNDVISGGGGADLLLAGHGNNQIYATAKVDIGAAIDQGAHGTASGQKGSFLAAGDGNNTLVGGLGNDAIFVGGGDNLIILGPGNDSVVAGVDVGNASSDWYTDVVNGTLTFENVNAASSPYAVPASFQGNTYNGVPVGAGNDTIFGGAGDDVRLTTMLLKSRRWRDGERNGIRSAANDSVFEIGRLG